MRSDGFSSDTTVYGCDALRQPDVGADDGVMADDRVAAQDGGVGVDDHLVLQRRVAFHAADDVAGRVAREATAPPASRPGRA